MNRMADTTVVNALLKSASDANDKLVDLQSSNSAATTQAGGIRSKVTELRNKLSDAKKDAETYNQEFLDRMNNGGGVGFMKLRGVSTLQDWVLLYFYIIFGILCLCMAGLAAYVAKNSVVAASVVLAFGTLIGCLMTAVLVRFA